MTLKFQREAPRAKAQRRKDAKIASGFFAVFAPLRESPSKCSITPLSASARQESGSTSSSRDGDTDRRQKIRARSERRFFEPQVRSFRRGSSFASVALR